MLDQLDHAMTAALHACDFTEFERLATLADRQQADREARLRAPGALAAAALWYATVARIPVFPLQPGGKRPLPGSRGFKDATTDPSTVAAWWRATPQANIGTPTGHRFDVIDIDGPAGYRSHADLRDAGNVPPLLARVHTPRGGMHLYIAPTGDGNATAVLDGVDYRGRGGYVLLPPSLVNGRRYDWIEPLAVTG